MLHLPTTIAKLRTGQSHPTFDWIFKHAQALADGAPYVPLHMPEASTFSDMMDALAKAHRQPGESDAVAFGRLMADDARMARLYAAYTVAKAAKVPSMEADAEEMARVRGHNAALRRKRTAPDKADKAAFKDHVVGMMEQYARLNRKSGESVAQAHARLGREDETYSDVYALLTEVDV